MRLIVTMRGLTAAMLLLALLACAGGEPLEPTRADEIPPGPGLFSGEDGEFVIYRR